MRGLSASSGPWRGGARTSRRAIPRPMSNRCVAVGSCVLNIVPVPLWQHCWRRGALASRNLIAAPFGSDGGTFAAVLPPHVGTAWSP